MFLVSKTLNEYSKILLVELVYSINWTKWQRYVLMYFVVFVKKLIELRKYEWLKFTFTAVWVSNFTTLWDISVLLINFTLKLTYVLEI